MTIEISESDILHLIEEDIKLNYLVFGLREVGVDCNPEYLNLSPIIFKMCGIDTETDGKVIDEYYRYVSSLQGGPFDSVSPRIRELAKEVYRMLRLVE